MERSYTYRLKATVWFVTGGAPLIYDLLPNLKSYVLSSNTQLITDWFQISWIEYVLKANKRDQRFIFHQSKANYFYVGRLFLLFHASLEVQCQILNFESLREIRKNIVYFPINKNIHINRHISRHVRKMKFNCFKLTQKYLLQIFRIFIFLISFFALVATANNKYWSQIMSPMDFTDWFYFSSSMGNYVLFKLCSDHVSLSRR